MQLVSLQLEGLKLVKPKIFFDERGFFFESYREELYLKHGMGPFVQDNTSLSRKDTVRALHFQYPEQEKLISCSQGKIWDVAVDIRPHSRTFMQWEAALLDDENHYQLYIPKGFAHGFCVLSETARVHYKVSSPYHSETEYSIRWNDPDLNIAWPVQDPILSLRDQTSPFFREIRDVVDHRL